MVLIEMLKNKDSGHKFRQTFTLSELLVWRDFSCLTTHSLLFFPIFLITFSINIYELSESIKVSKSSHVKLYTTI